MPSSGSPPAGTDLAADGEQVRDLYYERAHLLAVLAHRLAREAVIAYNDPREPALPVLYLDTAAGQISWHLNPKHLSLFDTVPVVQPSDPRAAWDGHDKNTALTRLRALAQLTSPAGESTQTDPVTLSSDIG
ncbi:hypothetical protein DI005_20770 [Prauserella sp. PE36]|uniref:WDGH domain-containing protein n=1 Tax=Prauserella sp. PE36 TaxID=1504709 RepID=UPI000DE28467|nr:hypothetical protein [Prauserella sp. PE36]RBM17965.1 hypothetical protein DI005_20770 [Prauserella sp. PE36]